MYEIESCGTTLDITPSHQEAINTYNRAVGPVVKLYKYNGSNKTVVQSKHQSLVAVSSFKQGK